MVKLAGVWLVSLSCVVLFIPHLALASSGSPDVPLNTSVVSDSALSGSFNLQLMFMQSDWVIKTIMIGLGWASLVTWSVFVAKSRELHTKRKQLRQTLQVTLSATSLNMACEQLIASRSDNALLVVAAQELHLSVNALDDTDGVKERVVSGLERQEAAYGRHIAQGTGLLATIGATAPFVGLFGTVWGIMHSFINLSDTQTTNLTVLAPGIAEALLTTALGLIAAIPAVVFYNYFARQISAYRALVADISAAVLRLVSRDLSHWSLNRSAGIVTGVKHDGKDAA